MIPTNDIYLFILFISSFLGYCDSTTIEPHFMRGIILDVSSLQHCNQRFVNSKNEITLMRVARLTNLCICVVDNIFAACSTATNIFIHVFH